jgi:CDP-glucose 4,6-dehydratase
MNNKFWINKNVFITGINGFVGGNLAEDLLNKGANVFGLIRNLTEQSYLFYMGLNKKIEIVNGNITDKEFLRSFFNENKIDICFHLAAQVEVGVAAKYPYLTWETNVRGTYTLLEAIRESLPDISAIVIASSDKAYGEYPIEELPYKEDYPLRPKYPYDTSKACADFIAQSYASNLFNMPIVITRFANIYGPGQLNFSALIPDLIRCGIGHGEFIPRSNGESKRDFLYVKDVADLYCSLAENLSNDKSNFVGEIFNAGTNIEKSVRQIVEKVYGILNNNTGLTKILDKFNKNDVAEGEINNQSMDFEKVYNNIGWSPKTNFEEGLEETIDWYRLFLSSENSI